MLQGIGNGFAHRRHRVIGNVFSKSLGNDGTGSHAILYQGQGFRQHVRDGTDNFLGVQILEAGAGIRGLGGAFVDCENDFQARKILLRKGTDGKKAGKRRTNFVFNAGENTELCEDGFVRQAPENSGEKFPTSGDDGL